MDNGHFMEVNMLHKYEKGDISAKKKSIVFTEGRFFVFQCGDLFTRVGSYMSQKWKIWVRAISTAEHRATHFNLDVRIVIELKSTRGF